MFDVSGDSDGNESMLWNDCDGMGDRQLERDGKGGRGMRPELFVKGWVANGSKESRRGERVIRANIGC